MTSCKGGLTHYERRTVQGVSPCRVRVNRVRVRVLVGVRIVCRSIVIDIAAPTRDGKVKPWLGLNEYTAACRSNKYKGAKLKKLYTDVAYTAALEAKLRDKWETPTKKVKVICIWHERYQRRDPDNIASGIKFVLDGLVKAQVIKDDSQRYIHGMPMHFLEYNKVPGVQVTIIEVD